MNKIPLKWNIPFGSQVDAILSLNEEILPISIVFRYKNFPEGQIIRYKDVETLRYSFINSIKESCIVKTGSAKEILNLSNKDTSRLMEIVSNPVKMYREYVNIEKIIYSNLTIKRYPVKVIFSKMEVILNKPFTIDEENSNLNCSVKEFLIKAFPDSRLLSQFDVDVIIYGEKVDVEAPILYFILNFNMLDGFLYMNIR